MEMFLQAPDTASERHESRQELFRERAIHNKHDRPAKVKALYQRSVKLWIGFLVDTERDPDSYEIKNGSPAPDVNLIKAFIRWYVFYARRGARTGVLPSMGSVLVCIEGLYAGLGAIARNAIPKEDRLEIFRWIKNDLRLIDPRSSRRGARQDRSVSRISEAAEEAHITAALRLVSLE